MADPILPAAATRPHGALPVTRGHLFAMGALALTMSVLSFFIGLQLGRSNTPTEEVAGVRPLLDEEARTGSLEALLLRVEQAKGADRLVFPQELQRSMPPLPPPAAAEDPAGEPGATEPAAPELPAAPAVVLPDEPRTGTASIAPVGAGGAVGGDVPSGGWALDLGTRQGVSDADQVVASLQSNGLKAYRVEARVDGRAVHHVRVGGYSSREGAAAAAAEVKARAGAESADPVVAP